MKILTDSENLTGLLHARQEARSPTVALRVGKGELHFLNLGNLGL